jgi:hypothetical protein
MSALCLAHICRYFWAIRHHRLVNLVNIYLAPWTGDRILRIGEFAEELPLPSTSEYVTLKEISDEPIQCPQDLRRMPGSNRSPFSSFISHHLVQRMTPVPSITGCTKVFGSGIGSMLHLSNGYLQMGARAGRIFRGM